MYTTKFGPRTATIPRSSSALAVLQNGESAASMDFNSTNNSIPSPRRQIAPLDATKLSSSVTEQYLARKKKDPMTELITADLHSFKEEEEAKSARRRRVTLEQRNALELQMAAHKEQKRMEAEEALRIKMRNKEADEAARRSIAEARQHQLALRKALAEGIDEQTKDLKDRRAKAKEAEHAVANCIVADALASKQEEERIRQHKKAVQERLNRQMMQEQDAIFQRKNELREERIQEERKLLAQMDARLAREEEERRTFNARRQRHINGDYQPLDRKAEEAKEKERILEEGKRTRELLKNAREQQQRDKVDSQNEIQALLQRQLETAEAKRKREREEALAERRRAEEEARNAALDALQAKSAARQRAVELREALEDQMSERLKRDFNLTEEEFIPISPRRRESLRRSTSTPRTATPRTGTPRR